MTNYLEFKNKGEIPVNAFKLLGASTKRNDNSKIGFFGTGLKYALAVMLREEINFKIFVGEKEVKIGLRNTTFGDKKIPVMTVNGEKTSITVDAGIDWKPWFAIREIYSNTLDEGGKLEFVTDLKPKKGSTIIYIEIDDHIGDVAKNWQDYFSTKREALYETSGYRILPKRSRKDFTMFRKGIRVHSEITPSLFDYDIEEIDINESRVAVYTYQTKQRAVEALAFCEDVGVLEQFIDATKSSTDYIELSDSSWGYLFFDLLIYKRRFSDSWLQAFGGKRIVPANQTGFYGMTRDSVALPPKLIEELHKYFGDALNLVGLTKEPYAIVADEFHSLLEKPLQVLEECGFSYPKEKIKIAKFQDRDIEGMYDEGRDLILISEEVLSPMSADKRLRVLFEEVAHAKSGFSDNTRKFENYLISLSLNLIQELKGKA